MTEHDTAPKTVEDNPDHNSEDGAQQPNAPECDVPSSAQKQIAEQAKFAEDTATG